MRTTLILIVSIIMSAGCSSGNNPGEAIGYAETLITDNDTAGAQKTCDGLMKVTSIETLSARELCRLAIIYMKLSESINTDENIAVATQCYRIANAAEPDTVTSFFSTVPIEEAQYEATLRSIARSLDNPQDTIEAEPSDSIHLITDSIPCHEK